MTRRHHQMPYHNVSHQLTHKFSFYRSMHSNIRHSHHRFHSLRKHWWIIKWLDESKKISLNQTSKTIYSLCQINQQIKRRVMRPLTIQSFSSLSAPVKWYHRSSITKTSRLTEISLMKRKVESSLKITTSCRPKRVTNGIQSNWRRRNASKSCSFSLLTR